MFINLEHHGILVEPRTSSSPGVNAASVINESSGAGGRVATGRFPESGEVILKGAPVLTEPKHHPVRFG